VTATLRAALAEGRVGGVRYATGRFSASKRPRTDAGVFHTDGVALRSTSSPSLLGREATAVARCSATSSAAASTPSVVTVSYDDCRS